MGSYANLKIAGDSFFETQSVVDPTIMTMFVESDRRTRRRLIDPEDNSEEPECELAYEYCIEARAAIRRLELLGFTEARARETFEMRIMKFIREIQEDELGPSICLPMAV